MAREEGGDGELYQQYSDMDQEDYYDDLDECAKDRPDLSADGQFRHRMQRHRRRRLSSNSRPSILQQKLNLINDYI